VNTDISQGSVVTHTSHEDFVASLLMNLSVKEF